MCIYVKMSKLESSSCPARPSGSSFGETCSVKTLDGLQPGHCTVGISQGLQWTLWGVFLDNLGTSGSSKTTIENVQYVHVWSFPLSLPFSLDFAHFWMHQNINLECASNKKSKRAGSLLTFFVCPSKVPQWTGPSTNLAKLYQDKFALL